MLSEKKKEDIFYMIYMEVFYQFVWCDNNLYFKNNENIISKNVLEAESKKYELYNLRCN